MKTIMLMLAMLFAVARAEERPLWQAMDARKYAGITIEKFKELHPAATEEISGKRFTLDEVVFQFDRKTQVLFGIDVPVKGRDVPACITFLRESTQAENVTAKLARTVPIAMIWKPAGPCEQVSISRESPGDPYTVMMFLYPEP